MKIAILGTRGIPNNYGGPETNAEMMSPIFLRLGHEVTVYSPDEHPYQESDWQGVKIRHIYNQESRFGIWGTLLYDYLCLRDALRSDFDVILELGYVPCAIFYPLLIARADRRRPRLLTNMDGLEWKRSKWNRVLQRFAELTEKLGARYSDAMISDNEAIRDYLLDKYQKDSYFIPYGAVPVDHLDPAIPQQYGVEAGGYNMLIARLEPENNIETILDGHVLAGARAPFLVVGKTSTRHGQYLVQKYASRPDIRFLGGIYDYAALSALRGQASLYFHGHSVGGTNPSLVEAMASNAFIAAHDNPFNRSVLEDRALYFQTPEDVSRLLATGHEALRQRFIEGNRAKTEHLYNWEFITREHVRAFEEILGNAPDYRPDQTQSPRPQP
ncbi:MAG: DUF1972 domain-containing protein [Pseudomonadota bacterium]